MKNTKNVFLLIAITFSFILGCGGVKGLLPKKGQFFDGDSAQTAATAVKEKIGKPFKVIEVFIDDNEFRVQAQDPNNPRNIDEYKYVAGFVTGPTAVKLNGMNEDVEKSSYPFGDIDFSAIPKFTKEAIDKAGIEGGKIYRLTFQRAFALTDTGAGALGNAGWHIEIQGTRENVTAAADPKGKLLGVDVSRTSKAADYTVFKREEMQKAQEAFKNQLGTRPEVVEIVMYDKYVMVKAPNPENPKVNDDYKFDINGLSRTGFVKMPSIKLPGRENFMIMDIDLPRAADLVEKTRVRLEMPGASVASFSIRRTKSPFDKKGARTLWDVSLKSGVKDGSVVYDNDGNEVRVRKNGEVIFEEK
jgi:hypothetical protein